MGRFSAGLKATQKSFSRPSRVVSSIRPGNPVTGLKGLTGAEAMETFGDPLTEFASRPRQALQAISKVRGRK